MESVHAADVYTVLRTDRITRASYPCCEDIQSLGRAKRIAEQETDSRLPYGDKFIVQNMHGEVIYEPD